ncbi:hypothetical protein CASFOL_008071 [Castilleja foliolosa]|uniref:Rapid ALkalinization Factor n=1 Tax=Castilleja foliolosa TaxID=1961234 RepID=A0ABD3DY85_9LAMI
MNYHLVCIVQIICLTVVDASSPYTQNHKHYNNQYHPTGLVSSKCDSIAGDCVDDSDTMISRRILAESGYISYEALDRDRVPCNVRGNSYYNCNTNERANPYTRGCTKITHCARNNH